MATESSIYTNSGVDTDREERGMAKLGEWVTRSFALRQGLGRPVLPLGHYANVIALDEKRGIAVSSDGVGTKLFIAEMMDRYDTVGIDCVAMNVNDLICIGAEPLALLDYIAVQVPHERLLAELGKGLYRACELANITIPGGEVAQVREMIRGVREDWSFDPFVFREEGGFFYGRGTSDNKAQLFTYLKTVETMKATFGELPISLKFLYEGEEEIDLRVLRKQETIEMKGRVR